MSKKLTKAEKDALKAERLARKLAASPAFSALLVAGNFPEQLAYLTCADQFAIALCSRRAGKTWSNLCWLALICMGAVEVNCLYIGLTEKAVRRDVINDVWKRVVRRYNLPFTDVNSDLTATHKITGSRISFASTDDIAHIESFRGGSYAGGGIVLDEVQSMSVAIATAMVESILLPMLSDTTAEHPTPGQLRLTGTIPTTPHGYLYKQYVDDENGWTKFRWSRFSNVNLTDQAAHLAKKLALLKVPVTHPMIQRDDFGELVFDENDTAYRYVQERSTYEPASLVNVDIGPFHCTFAPIQDFDRVIVGIDPAQRKDRFAMTVFGFNSKTKKALYQIGECVTEPGADPQETEWLDVLKHIKSRYHIVSKVIRDPGSSAPTNDVLKHSHGIIVESAIKGPGSLKARVDLLADLLFRSKCLVIKGGELDIDLQSAKWNLNELERGKWAFRQIHVQPGRLRLGLVHRAVLHRPRRSRPGRQTLGRDCLVD